MHTTPRAGAKKKGRRRWGWLALAGMMCLALSAVGWWVLARPAFAPKGEIAFQCRGVARTPRSIAYTQICVINADGSGQRRLTDFDFDVGWPAWSPDGQRLAFAATLSSHAIPYGRLYVADADGSNPVALTPPDMHVRNLAWSPKGEQLIVRADVEKQSGLYLVSAAEPEAEPVLLREGEYFFSKRAWSPDGRYIAVKQRDADAYLLDAQNGDIVQQLPGVCVSPAWDFAGNRLLCEGGLRSLRVLDARTLAETRIFNWPMLISLVDNPAWSPDGDYIAYEQTHWPTFLSMGGNGELWIMRADGSQATKLTDGPIDQSPDWRPVP